MTQLRYLVDDPSAMWALKDRLRESALLRKDPVQMNRTLFERWLEVKAKVELAAAIDRGVTDVQEAVVERLAPYVQAWRLEAAKRYGR